MKKWQVLSLVGLNTVILLAAYQLKVLGKANSQILVEIQAQQTMVARVTMMQKFRESLEQDIANASVTDAAMKSLLVRHVYNSSAASAAGITPPATNLAPTPSTK